MGWVTVVREDMDLPGLHSPLATVTIELAGEGCAQYSPAYNEPNKTIIGALRLKPEHGIAPNGYWEVDLVPNSLISPPGTGYRITRKTSDGDVAISCISVPASGGPFGVSDLLIDPPGAIESAALALHLDTLHIPHVTVPAAWGEWWRIAREEADTRVVRVQVWTDSIGCGQGATNPLTEGWVSVVETAVQARYGDGGSGYRPWSLSNSSTGTWTPGIGFSGAAGTATAAASRTFTVRGTEIRIFFRGLGITGSFRYRVDGGGFTTITTPTGIVEPGVVVLTGLSNTTHTLEVEWVSGTVTLHGVEARRANGVITQICGQSGRAACDYSTVPIDRVTVTANGTTTITSAVPGSFTSTMIGRNIKDSHINDDTTITAVASATSATLSQAAAGSGTADAILSLNPSSRPGIPGTTMQPAFDLVDGLEVPDVIILCVGANDPGANTSLTPTYDAQSFSDALGVLLRPATTSGTLTFSPELIVIVEHFGTWIDISQLWPELVAVMASFAAGNGGALVDVWGAGRRSWAFWNALGYFADAIHPSTAGHRQYAQPVIDLLTR